MSVIVGSDGAVKINLGNGLKYIANIRSWQAKMNRDMLPQTTLADETERNTGGLASWSGDFGLRLEFSDDESVALSSWQFLDFAINNSDNDLKAELHLIIQSQGLDPSRDIFKTTVPGIIKLVGTVVIGSTSLNCEDPAEAVIAVINWSGDGPMQLQRTAL